MQYLWTGYARKAGFSNPYEPGIITQIEELKCFYNKQLDKFGVFAIVSDGYKTTSMILWNYQETLSALEDLKYANVLDHFDMNTRKERQDETRKL
jgi:hypothetical protein